jgi:hypothetical protein
MISYNCKDVKCFLCCLAVFKAFLLEIAGCLQYMNTEHFGNNNYYSWQMVIDTGSVPSVHLPGTNLVWVFRFSQQVLIKQFFISEFFSCILHHSRTVSFPLK